MRLWHKDLIDVLPRQQLIAQWRECCCIAKNIADNGYPNHILVNKIMDFGLSKTDAVQKIRQYELERKLEECPDISYHDMPYTIAKEICDTSSYSV